MVFWFQRMKLWRKIDLMRWTELITGWVSRDYLSIESLIPDVYIDRQPDIQSYDTPVNNDLGYLW